jgi:hypothetical protein
LATRLLVEENGDILVLTAVSLVMLVGFLALALDAGNLLYAKRHMQTLADAAAIAGSYEVQQCGGAGNCSVMVSAVTSAASENGYTSPSIVTNCGAAAASGVTVSINNGPCALGAADPNNGNKKYVEAVATVQQRTFFAGVLGFPIVTVAARSEAGPFSGSKCLYTLAGSGSKSFDLDIGTMVVDCAISIASVSSGSLYVDDSGSSLQAISISLAGDASSVNVLSGGSITPSHPTTNVAAPLDPLGNLPTPSIPSTTYTADGTLAKIQGATTLNPGYYPNGIDIGGSGYTITLNPGLYYIAGTNNLVIPSVTLRGTGVTLYLAKSALTFRNQSVFNVSAPTSGTYAGILYFEAHNNTTNLVIDNDLGSAWQGVIYVPNANVEVDPNIANPNTNSSSANDINAGAAYTIIIAQNFELTGGQPISNGVQVTEFSMKSDYSSLPNGLPPTPMAFALKE